jgi:hypothetical protein
VLPPPLLLLPPLVLLPPLLPPPLLLPCSADLRVHQPAVHQGDAQQVKHRHLRGGLKRMDVMKLDIDVNASCQLLHVLRTAAQHQQQQRR